MLCKRLYFAPLCYIILVLSSTETTPNRGWKKLGRHDGKGDKSFDAEGWQHVLRPGDRGDVDDAVDGQNTGAVGVLRSRVELSR